MADLQALFQEIRGACTSRSWSKGIELARTDAVDGVALQPEEATLRVRSAGRTVAPTVILYLEDLEWDCDCDTQEDVCEHVAASIIALRRAQKEGRDLPTSKKAGGRIQYVLATDDDRLEVQRWVVRGDERTKLESSLAALIAGRASGPSVEPSKVDLSIDALLTAKRVRSYAFNDLVPFLSLLAEVDDVQLDGEKVRVSATPLGPRVWVRDAENRGATLRFERSASLVRTVVRGLVLAGGEDGATLRPLAMTEVTGLLLEKLPSETHYPRGRVAELISEVLPRLKQTADVIVEAKRLPDKQRSLDARPLVKVEQRGAALHIVALIVYGDPPCARIDMDGRDGTLVHIGGPVPARDMRGERRVAATLREQLDLVPGRRAELTGSAALAAARKLRRFKGEVDGTAHRDCYPNKPLKAEVEIRGDGLTVTMTAGGSHADAQAVIDAWRAGSDVAPLTGGGWAEIPSDWLSQHGTRLEQLLAARGGDGTVAPHARPALAALCRDLEHPPVMGLDRLLPLLESFEGLPHAKLPADLQADLRDYQKRGVDWLSLLRDAELGAILADDMGLGKTLQALTALRGRTLVVCPKSVVHNWADEIERFRPSLRYAIYHGAKRELTDADVTLTTYALMRGDIERLASETWDTVVLDESQTIKNPDSQVAQAAFRLEARFRLTLSGTPVENRLEELWSQMHFVNPGLLGGRTQFRDRVARPIESGDPDAGQRLRDKIRPFVLRRTKTAVLSELPPRTDAVMHCALDEDERNVYAALSLATKKTVVAQLEAGGGVMQALEALLRLRQAACDTSLVPGASSDGRTSSKVRRLLLALEDAAADGHKALVFSQWTSLLDRVEPELEGAAIPFLRLDGKTRDRAAVVRAFQDPDGPPVLLISLKAGGTGLNLTAADHVFLLDPWWNPAAEDQAADRAHRIGQDRPVMVYRLVAKDTVEERILALQERKRALAQTALEGTGGAAKLTRDDLLALFD